MDGQSEQASGVHVSPSQIPDAGMGLYTTMARKRGDRIVRYEGQRYDYRKNREASEAMAGDYLLMYKPHQFIDAACPETSGLARYCNDCTSEHRHGALSRGNNCRFVYDAGKDEVWLTATRNLEAGEECFVAYGSNSYWKRRAA